MDDLKLKTTPKDFFLWVGAVISLYISAVSLLVLLFEYIDILFVNSLVNSQDLYSGTIRFSIASLIVIFPLYLYLTSVINKDIRANPQKREIGVRRWLIFLTLFVSGITIIVDLIVLINKFLGGEELTYGFILKVLSIFIIIGGVFLYYFYDIHNKWENSKSASKIICLVVSTIVLSAIVGGFLIMGSPQTQRLIRFDQGKTRDLSRIQWQIVDFYRQKDRLPKTLKEIEDPLTGIILPKDSQTGKEYKYILKDNLKFDICANFNKESRGYGKIQISSVALKNYSGYGSDKNWIHSEGETCFERTIDPDKFPVINKQ